MRKLICLLLLMLILQWPLPSYAAGFDFNMNINIMWQSDGTTCGEFWYNNQVIWRVAILADGAKPVSGGPAKNTIFIVPDIVDGLFMVKVDNQ